MQFMKAADRFTELENCVPWPLLFLGRLLACMHCLPQGFYVTSCDACQVRRTISRFKDRAYSGCFRRDGKLLAAGGEDALVQARA